MGGTVNETCQSIETCHTFGSENHLVGIAHHAAESSVHSDSDGPHCLVMLTAGMLPSAGPFRLHVEMAKTVARHGVSSFRFDLSGIGESLAVGTAIDSTHRAVAETQSALDFLQQRYGWTRFILFGLCSGADDALNVALADDRVVAAIMLDGCGYRTSGYHVHRFLRRYLPNLFRPQKLLRKAKKLLGSTTGDEDLPPPDDDIREFPDRPTAERQFQALADRGVSILQIYTGGVHDYFNHLGQFKQMFPELNDRGHIDVRFYPHWDHVLYLDDDRQQLLQLIGTFGERLGSDTRLVRPESKTAS